MSLAYHTIFYDSCFCSRIYVCDLPSKYEALKEAWKGALYNRSAIYIGSCYTVDTPNVHVLRDGHGVARISDWMMYSVEAEYVDRVVAEYGPCAYIYLISVPS